MRLFIASPVTLDDYPAVKDDFAGIIEGKWVEEENLHLTWVFLGETTEKEKEAVIDRLQSIRPMHEPSVIRGLGYFGRPPHIFFAKSEAKSLYDKAGEFKKAGFDLYRFKPHITLCRIRRIHNYRAYKEKLGNHRDRILGTVNPGIALYQSRLTEKGPEYACIWKAKSRSL